MNPNPNPNPHHNPSASSNASSNLSSLSSDDLALDQWIVLLYLQWYPYLIELAKASIAPVSRATDVFVERKDNPGLDHGQSSNSKRSLKRGVALQAPSLHALFSLCHRLRTWPSLFNDVPTLTAVAVGAIISDIPPSEKSSITEILDSEIMATACLPPSAAPEAIDGIAQRAVTAETQKGAVELLGSLLTGPHAAAAITAAPMIAPALQHVALSHPNDGIRTIAGQLARAFSA